MNNVRLNCQDLCVDIDACKIEALNLSGTPTSAQVGPYPHIRISVSDGTTTVSLAALTITVVLSPVASFQVGPRSRVAPEIADHSRRAIDQEYFDREHDRLQRTGDERADYAM